MYSLWTAQDSTGQHRPSDLVTHLRTSDACYRATVPAEFLATNQPPMFITLYFIVSHLPDSLRSVRDHFLSLDPTSLTVDLLEQHLLTAETSAFAVGSARGTPRSPFFEGCSPSPLSPSFASAAAADVSAASTSAKRRSSKGKGGRGGGGGSGGGGGGSGSGGGGSGGGGGGSGGGGGGGTSGGSGGSGGGVGGSGGSGGSGGGGTGGGRSGPWRGGPGGGQRQQQQRRSETQSLQQLCEWLVQRGRVGVVRATCIAEGDCYRCVPPDPGIAAAALGASASGTTPGTAPAETLHTFMLDSGTLRSFFRDSTTLTPLPAPVPIRLADPSGGPVVARSSTVLPCSAVPSGSLSRLHLPSFSTNLVSTAALQDAMVTTTIPGGQRVSICTCTRTGHHLATFTRRPGSSLYTLATKPPQVAVSAQVSASGQVAASCSCRLLSHQTLLWHHCLGHPSLPRLRGMHSRFLVSGLPSGQGHERYFLLVVDDYTRYTTIFPLQSKGEVPDVLIPWIRTVRLQLERFGTDLPVLRLRSDRGGEGILQLFTLPDSPQQNGIAERHIGLVMEVARTSMIHAAAPHFLWPFAVRYAAHQLNLWPRVSLPETSPTLRWTGKVGDASVFRVWGSRAFVRDTSADKLSARAIPCVFLGFVAHAPGWQFYHPTSRCVLPSQDVTFDESVPFYRLFPYRSAPPLPPPLFLANGPPPVDPLPPQGPGPSGVSQVDPLPGTKPIQVAVGSGAAPGAASRGAASGGVASGGAEPGGAGVLSLGGAESEGAESGGAAPRGAASSGGPAGASPRLSSQQLLDWLIRRTHHRSGAPGAGGAGDTGPRGVAVPTGGTAVTGPGGARTSGAGAAGTGGVGCAGDPTEPRAAGAGGTGAGGAGVGGPGVGGTGVAGAGVGGTGAGSAGAAGAGAVDPGAGGAGGTVRPRPYFPASPLPVPSPYTEQSGSLTERREPTSRPTSPVRTARRAPRVRRPPVPGTHTMALRPSSVPLCVPLPSPPESSLPEVPDPESDRACAASPTVACLLATTVTDPSFESATASALVAELLDLAAACRLDYASALVAESVPASPPSVGGECALGTDVLEDRQDDFECLATVVPRFASLLLAPEGDPDARDIPTPRSYAEAITDLLPHPEDDYSSGVAAQRDYELHSLDFSTAFLQGSLHEEIWLRRPPGFTGTFPAKAQWSLRRPVYGLRQAPREWHDTLRTTLAALGFAPSTADPSLFLRTDTSLPPFYVLVYVDDLVFSTADTYALTLVKSELQKRHTCTDLGELRSYLDLQITQDRARRTITLTQSHMVHQVLQRFGFQFSSPQPTPLSTSHTLSAPPSDESVEPSGPYPELVGCLVYLMTCTRPDLAYPLSLLARYVAPGRHRKVH
ncbi:unnamed protein product [Closterium sp. NIES-54]